MKFGHIEILCRDTRRARRFYEETLGFELVAEQSHELIWLQLGQQEILLRPGSPPAEVSRYEDAATGFVLYTDNLPETLASLRARGLEPRGFVDSEKCVTFTDPDGNWFQLVDPEDHS